MRNILILALSGLITFSCADRRGNSGDAGKTPGPDLTSAAVPDPARLKRLAPAFAAVDRIYGDHAEKNHYPGMAYGVVLDGALVHSGAVGMLDLQNRVPASATSLFRIASMTKSFTAMAIMKLRDRGRLSLSDPAENFIPEMREFRYPTSDSAPVTIQNLLTMTAGFPEDNPWGDRQLEDTNEELLTLLGDGISFSNAPGVSFEYSNLGYAILGNIITRVSGMPYQKYITDEILRPLGMNDTQWEFSVIAPEKLALGYRWEEEMWKPEPMLHDGAYGAMGGLITSISDFSKYVALHLQAWPPSGGDDEGPLKRNSIREMHRPFLPTLHADAKRANGTPCPVVSGYCYGLGYRQDCEGTRRISHSGGLPGFGSEFRFFPEYGIGLISFANRTYAGAGAANARVFDTLIHISGLRPRVLPPSEILLARREQLIGFLKNWDVATGDQILAENFYLDMSRELRMKQAGEVLGQIGKIVSYEPMVPENRLRGTFDITGEKGVVRIFFTLTPEAEPRVQQLDIWLVNHE